MDPAALVDVLRDRALGGLAVAEGRAWRERLGGLADQVLENLEPDYRRMALQATLTRESAARARSALTAAEIPSLVFKGVALIEAGIYPDPGARDVGDADLLVRPERADEAVHALVDVGFEPWVPWNPTRLTWLPAFTFSDPVGPPGMDLTLDLHWATPYGSLRSAAAQESDPLWERADLARGLPAPEPHYALVAQHFLKHLRVHPHLAGLADLVRLGPRLRDVELLRRQLEERRSMRGMRLVAGMLRDSFGVTLPEPLVGAIGPVLPLTGAAGRWLALDRLIRPDAHPMGRVEGVIARWRLMGGAGQVARELGQVAFPSGRWLRARYSDRPGGLLRLRARYVREVWAWTRGRGASPLSPNQEFVW